MSFLDGIVQEVHGQVFLTTEADTEIDFSGFDSMKIRHNLGAADEFNMTLPAQLLDGEWRPDMPQWKNGATIKVMVGWDGELDELQTFEVVSTSTMYNDSGGENMVVRAASDLARAARNKASRTFDTSSDFDIISEICDEYGWTNGTSTAQFVFRLTSGRVKEAGTSDLEFLRLIATESRLGGPTLDKDKTLTMPSPIVGELVYTRGSSEDEADWRRLHSFQPNRESGHTNTRVSIRSWDPVQAAFVEVIFEADPFGGDPEIVFEGTVASQPVADESSTAGLTLSVVESRGQGKKERHDVLVTGRFQDETSAEDLATRWFDLREKLSRWATAVVDGHIDLKPYVSIDLQGNLAESDKGPWLPIFVEHTIGNSGWKTKCRCIRIVDEPVIAPAPA